MQGPILRKKLSPHEQVIVGYYTRAPEVFQTMKRKNPSVTHKRPKKKVRTATFNAAANNVGAFTNRNAVEWKNIDAGSTILNPSASGISWPTGVFLNGIALGNTPTTRIGRKVALTKLQVRWTRISSSIATIGGVNVLNQYPFRILVVYDRSPTGVIPVITDILVATTFEAPLNLNNTERFLVLADEYPIKDQGHTAITVGGKFNRKWPKALACQWGGAGGGTIADISCGAIYLYFGCPQPTGNESLTFYSRIRYADA